MSGDGYSVNLTNLSASILRSDVSNDFEVDIQIYCLVSCLFIIHIQKIII